MFSRIFLRTPRNLAPLAAISWAVTIKDLLGIEKVQLDKDPIKNKIKQSTLHRKYHRNDEAIDVLNEALVEAKATKCEEYISRVYDELANTYYEMGNFEAAESLFRELIHRLIRLHSKNEESPEFIGISLKLADIFAQKGDLESAEVGLKHCVSKQMKVMEEHQGKILTGKEGHMVGSAFPVDELGCIYTDPIVLFAVSLEQYAHFLIDYCGEDRLREAEEYMDEAVKISYYVYGMHDSHTVTILNVMGVKCLLRERYDLAKKYLEIGIDRILMNNDCSSMIVSYYCAYAEALFHTGEPAKALEIARKAERFSYSQEPRIRDYAEKFRRDLENDTRRFGVKRKRDPPKDGTKEENEESVKSWWRSWL